ncbi:MAG: TerB family tellurite resistance protein [Terricaulis sp.]
MVFGNNNRPSAQPEITVFKTLAAENNSPFNVDRLADRFKYQDTGWSIPEAILCILFSAAMADGSFAEEEQAQVQLIARRSRALRALSPQDLATTNNTVNQRMAQNRNSLQEACKTLPADMCLPYFAHCVDIVLSDGQLAQTETDFLHALIPMLDIDEAHARRVMEVLLLKAQY